jgi:hypothetical protein
MFVVVHIGHDATPWNTGTENRFLILQASWLSNMGSSGSWERDTDSNSNPISNWQKPCQPLLAFDVARIRRMNLGKSGSYSALNAHLSTHRGKSNSHFGALN